MYEIILSKKAQKFLGKLEKDIRERILNSLEKLRFRPEAHLTKVVGDTSYKFRVGDYRVIIDLEKDRLLILVIKIGHRKNIYN